MNPAADKYDEYSLEGFSRFEEAEESMTLNLS